MEGISVEPSSWQASWSPISVPYGHGSLPTGTAVRARDLVAPVFPRSAGGARVSGAGEPAVSGSPPRLRAGLADRGIDLEEELGRGGTSIVYRATDRKHARPVVVKVLRPEVSAALGTIRFLREIQFAAVLRHPHLLPLYDSGAVDGLLFYVMPYIEGESLRQRLTRSGRLPIDEALRIAAEVADALAAAHVKGIVHRDIKPENILLEAGHALVADFGVGLAMTRAAREHAGVHEPRAGERRDGGRRPQRPVQPRLCGVRDADGRAAVHGAHDARDHRASAPRSAGAGAAAPAKGAGGGCGRRGKGSRDRAEPAIRYREGFRASAGGAGATRPALAEPQCPPHRRNRGSARPRRGRPPRDPTAAPANGGGGAQPKARGCDGAQQ
ncbi:MAG: serine/threonine protein kinase [Gemmatimonadetes bacterium]|nr:MAG: serine/threonine protein kinase [Gemmatimonadota bacterium]